MKTVDARAGILMVDSVIDAIRQNKQYLSDIDGLIGDGDHGINMNKGVTICREALDANPVKDASEAFALLSRTLMMKIGGSMGPLYGMFFKGFAEAFKDKAEIAQGDVLLAFDGAVNHIRKISQAGPGDKTLMDTLLPSRQALKDALSEGLSFEESVRRMQGAARNGAESTKDMIARLGRASKLGERSRGVQDAGATSCCLIIEAIGNAIIKLLQ